MPPDSAAPATNAMRLVLNVTVLPAVAGPCFCGWMKALALAYGWPYAAAFDDGVLTGCVAPCYGPAGVACAADADSAGAVACALWDCGAVDASGAAGVAAAVVVPACSVPVGWIEAVPAVVALSLLAVW